MYHGTAGDFFVGVLMLGLLAVGPLVLAIVNLILSWRLKLPRQVWYSCFNLVVAGSFPFLLWGTNQFEWPLLLKWILKITAFGIPIQLVYLAVRRRMRGKQPADIKTPAKILKLDSDKRALLDKLSRENRTLLFFYDEAPPVEIPHERVSGSITLVHPPYDYEQLKKWLYLGNWQAISPASPHYQPFDTFKAEAPDIAQRMQRSSVKLVIDSFHDDIEWNVIGET